MCSCRFDEGLMTVSGIPSHPNKTHLTLLRKHFHFLLSEVHFTVIRDAQIQQILERLDKKGVQCLQYPTCARAQTGLSSFLIRPFVSEDLGFVGIPYRAANPCETLHHNLPPPPLVSAEADTTCKTDTQPQGN